MSDRQRMTSAVLDRHYACPATELDFHDFKMVADESGLHFECRDCGKETE